MKRNFTKVLWLSVSVLFSEATLANTVEGGNSSLSQNKPTLPQLVEAYQQRTGFFSTVEAMQQKAQAQADSANSWRAGDVEVVVHHETDLLNDDLPMRNWQLGAGMSVLLPSQQKALQAVAESSAKFSDNELRYAAWLASAQLRQLLWDLKSAEQNYSLDKQAVEVNKNLVSKVSNQVRIGERAKLDLIVAEQTLLEAEVTLQNSQLNYENSLQAYQEWTGFKQLPADIVEQQVMSINPEHPELDRLKQQKVSNQAQLEWVKAEKSGNPSLFLGLQNDTVEGQSDDSVIFEVSFPLGLDPTKSAALAEQKLEISKTSYEINQKTRQIQLQLKQDSSRLIAEQKMLKLNADKLALAEESYRLSQEAYRLGEIDIQSLLQAQTKVIESKKVYENSKISRARKVAEYNQLAGYLLGEKQK